MPPCCVLHGRGGGAPARQGKSVLCCHWGSSHQVPRRGLGTCVFFVALFTLLLGLWHLPVLFWDSGATLDGPQTGPEAQAEAVPALRASARPRQEGGKLGLHRVSHGHR